MHDGRPTPLPPMRACLCPSEPMTAPSLPAPTIHAMNDPAMRRILIGANHLPPTLRLPSPVHATRRRLFFLALLPTATYSLAIYSSCISSLSTYLPRYLLPHSLPHRLTDCLIPIATYARIHGLPKKAVTHTHTRIDVWLL